MDQQVFDSIKKTIPETYVLETFKRPLVMDDLIERIERYMEENTGEGRKKTILIVDDDITYMRTVYEWLKDTYHVGMASSGVQAIRSCRCSRVIRRPRRYLLCSSPVTARGRAL